MQSLKKILTADSKNKQVLWAQIRVKMTHFVAREVFFRNWAPSLFFKHKGVMQSMQSFKKILMVDPMKSCVQT